jgi:hypothetical protein
LLSEYLLTTIHFFTDKPVNTEFVAKSPLLVGTTVNLECAADADPKAEYSISGGGIAPGLNSDKTGIFSFTVDLSRDGSNVTCTPFNTLGNGPARSLILDVQGKILFVHVRTASHTIPDEIQLAQFYCNCAEHYIKRVTSRTASGACKVGMNVQEFVKC